MKRSQIYGLLGVLCIAAALMLGLAWFIVCTATGVGLLMNGPWFIAVLIAALGAVFGFASHVADLRERDEAKRRADELKRLIEEEVRNGAILADKIEVGTIRASISQRYRNDRKS